MSSQRRGELIGKPRCECGCGRQRSEDGKKRQLAHENRILGLPKERLSKPVAQLRRGIPYGIVQRLSHAIQEFLRRVNRVHENESCPTNATLPSRCHDSVKPVVRSRLRVSGVDFEAAVGAYGRYGPKFWVDLRHLLVMRVLQKMAFTRNYVAPPTGFEPVPPP